MSDTGNIVRDCSQGGQRKRVEMAEIGLRW
jgi:hypothetical protein